MLFSVFSAESTAGTEAEKEAPGAADGSVQRGQPGEDAQDEAFGGTGTAGRVLSQQQQQHHLSWYRMSGCLFSVKEPGSC